MQTSVGPYRIEGELGRGGMGAVLRARGPDGALVAVKVILGARPGSTDRFAREARLLSELGERDGFVPILASGVGPGGPWFAMPLLEGGSLRDRLRGGPLGLHQAVQLVTTIARAVGVAHARGIVHRDLKPDNVLFTGQGRPLVSDLGLAKHFDPAAPGAGQSVALTRTGELRGTLGYMAPEQINDAKSVGPQADVFALASILHELLAGRCPFDGDTPHEIIARIVQGEAAQLSDSRPDAPRWLRAVLARALDRDPAARHPDGEAFARALEARDAGSTRPRVPRGRALLVVAALIALIALVAFVAFGAGAAVVATRSPRVESDGPPTPPTPRATPGPTTPNPTQPSPTPDPTALPASAAMLRATGALRLVGAWGTNAGRTFEPPAAVRCTPGDHVVLGEQSGRVVVWSRRTGTFVRRLALLPAAVRDLALTRDGALCAVGAADGTVTLIEVATGRTRWTAAAPRAGEARGVALSPDGRLAVWVVQGDPLGVCVADVATGAVHELKLPVEGTCVAFRPDDATRFLVGGGGRGTLGEFDVQWGSAVRALDAIGSGSVDGPQGLHTVAVSADGRLAMGADGRGGCMLWDLRDGSSTRRLGDPSRVARAVALDPAGRRAAAAVDDRALVWDLERGGEPAELVHASAVLSLDFAPGGSQLITGCEDRRARAWELVVTRGRLEGRPVWDPEALFWISGVARDGERKLLVSGAQGVERWDLTTGHASSAYRGHPGTGNGFALHPDGAQALSIGHDRTARRWRRADGEERQVLTVGRNNVLCCAWSQDGTRALIGTDDPSILVLDEATGKVVGVLPGLDLWPDRVLFAGDAALAVTHGGVLLAWDARTLEPRLRVQAHAGSASVDARGGLDRVVTCGADEVALWDLTGQTARERARHALPGAAHARLLPDRARAVVSTDALVVLVDLATGAELGRLDLSVADDPARTLSVDDDACWVGTQRGLVLRLGW